MRKNKRVLTFILFVLLYCTQSIIPTFAKEIKNVGNDINFYVTDERLIRESAECLDNKEYTKRLLYFGESYKLMLEELMENSDNQENKIGFYNVRSINIKSVNKIKCSKYNLDQYKSASLEADDISLYIVITEVETYLESEFYNSGVRSDIYAVGTINNERKIISIRKAPERIIKQFTTYMGELW